MSSTVRSYGFIAVLKTPLPKEKRDDLSDGMFDDDSQMDILECGELVFLDYNRRKALSQRENIYGLCLDNNGQDPQDLVKEAAKYELEVDESTIRPFNCIWRTGSNCPIWGLTKAEYLSQTGQKRDPQEDWVCPDCGADDIQVMDWVEVNTNTPQQDPDAGDYWCLHCEKHYRGVVQRKDFEPKQPEEGK